MPQTCTLDFSDDDLELYALGRLGQELTDSLEEHLLLCQSCRDRMERTDRFVVALRQALVPEAPVLETIRRDGVAAQE